MSPLSFPHLSPTVVCNSFHTARCRCIEQQGGKFSVYLKCKTSMVLHVERLTRNIDISWLYQQATWFQLPWQLNNVIFWDPSKKSVSPFSPLTAFSHWCAFTSPQFTRKSTQMHTGQVHRLLPAPDASCPAAVGALLPEPVQHNSLQREQPACARQHGLFSTATLTGTQRCALRVVWTACQFYSHTCKFPTLCLLFACTWEGSLKASFSDPRILTFKQKEAHKAPHSGYNIPLLRFFPCNVTWTPPAASEELKAYLSFCKPTIPMEDFFHTNTGHAHQKYNSNKVITPAWDEPFD